MPFGSILLILALLLIVGFILAKPFLQAPASTNFSQEEELELLAERERIIEALLELDFDQRMGKVPTDIYETQREHLVRQGAEVLKKLDGRSKEFDRTELGEADLEALIAAHKAKRWP
ncbi:MAG: hypothetical protein O3B43_00555 [Chloroflexi bacterium]|nr:hypothetical protein [Chloroflexota bacterium]